MSSKEKQHALIFIKITMDLINGAHFVIFKISVTWKSARLLPELWVKFFLKCGISLNFQADVISYIIISPYHTTTLRHRLKTLFIGMSILLVVQVADLVLYAKLVR